WKYGSLKCGIDPVDLIAADWASGHYDLNKVGLLKELGRAAYESPAKHPPLMATIRTDERRRAERGAAKEVEHAIGAEVRECPVCGVKALVQYEDSNVEDGEDGQHHITATFPYLYRCLCCTLEVDYHLDNPSAYGLPIPDLW